MQYDRMSKIDHLIEIHNLKRNNTHILGETQNQALQMNAILNTREEVKKPFHMLDTAVDGEPLLCVNESLCKNMFHGTGREGGKKTTKRVSSGRSEKIRTGVFAY